MTSQRCFPTATQRLEQAETLVVRGQEQIHRQKQFVDTMERTGEDSALAHEVLNTLEDAQVLRLADRDRLRKKLERISLTLQSARLTPQVS
jgi:uncharacterized protein YydD (DUF2326 family)